MAWFKVDDHLHSHRKAMRAGTEAMGLWVLAGSWSGAEESDGWVPSYVLTRLAGPGADELAERLARAGLWHADVVDGEDGYRFHEWDTYQPTREQQEAKREQARERMRRVRANGGSTSRAVTPTPTRPDPTPTTTPAADAASDAGFDAFWSAYPRKVGKAAAAKAFAKAIGPDVSRTTILDGLENARQVWAATGTEARFIPHPATWLNQGRWADEVPLPDAPPAERGARPAITPGQCGQADCPGTRHEWTDARNRFMCMGDQ
jgi:hypothetical protein